MALGLGRAKVGTKQIKSWNKFPHTGIFFEPCVDPKSWIVDVIHLKQVLRDEKQKRKNKRKKWNFYEFLNTEYVSRGPT